jgi:hypothetical protein
MIMRMGILLMDDFIQFLFLDDFSGVPAAMGFVFLCDLCDSARATNPNDGRFVHRGA